MRTVPGIFAAIVSWLASGGVAAQMLPGTGSPVTAHGRGHGWVCVPVRPDASAVVVLHVPPRGRGVSDGSVSKAVELPRAPERLASWENTLFMVFPPEPAAHDTTQRRVVELSVAPGHDGMWRVVEDGQRLPARASLPGRGRLLGVVGTPLGPAALLQPDDRPPEFRVLVGSEWRLLEPPPGLTDAAGTALAAGPLGPEVLDINSGRAWTGRVSGDRRALSVEWSPRSDIGASFEAAGGETVPVPAGDVLALPDGYVFWSGAAAGGLRLWSVTAAGTRAISSYPGVGPRSSIASLPGNGRMVVVWSDATPGEGKGTPGGSASIRHRMLEVSAYTGEVLYSGPARSAGPVSSQELKLLAALLTLVMAVILVFVFRPDGAGAAVSLPRHVVLCDPARRIGAGIFDAVGSALVAGQITGVSIAEMVAPWSVQGDAGALVTLAVAAAIGFGQCTLGEWLWGRSLGKAISGCAVAVPRMVKQEGVLTPVLARPALWRAAGRNLVKWVLPPVALAGVVSASRRHKGDVLAGTVVVVPAEGGPADDGEA